MYIIVSAVCVVSIVSAVVKYYLPFAKYRITVYVTMR